MQLPYKLHAAVDDRIRHKQMKIALGKGYPRLKAVPIVEGQSISIACYGPSLEDTWKDLERPILTVSGALHFLAERGIIPDYHVDCDPRPHKVRHVQPAIDGVHYIMGSCCHPDTWKALKGQKISLVHFHMSEKTEKFLALNDPGSVFIRPGSTVGLAAIHVAGMLGFRHFEIHGMDGCIREGKRHAGPHYGHAQGGVTWQAGNVVYQTSKIMANACAEVIITCQMYPIFPVFHGKGLQQALIDEEYGLDNAALAWTPKAAMVRRAKATFLKEIHGLKSPYATETSWKAETGRCDSRDGLSRHNLPA